MPTKSTPAGDPAVNAGEILNTKGIVDNKLSHSYRGTIPREEGEYQILLFVSHKLEKPNLCPWGGKSTFYPLPCLTIQHTPLLQNRSWLEAPLQDKAGPSWFSRLPLYKDCIRAGRYGENYKDFLK